MENQILNKIQASSLHIQNMKRLYILSIGIFSLTGVFIALYQLFHVGITYLEISLFFGMFFLTTAFGVEVGFHRYFSHKSFKATRILEILMVIFGSMAGQGSLIAWVSVHRCHHQYTDEVGDPHSPHLHGDSFFQRLKGVWYAHIGWLMNDKLPNSLVFAKDVLKDSLLLKLNKFYLLWLFLGLLIPTILGGVITQSWIGFFQGFLWGGVARLFFSFNTGYLVNSLGHIWGKQDFLNKKDQSRNNFILGIITMGGGWHNNHHKFPHCASNTIKWWQFDLCYGIIFTLKVMGLAWDIKLPSLSISK